MKLSAHRFFLMMLACAAIGALGFGVARSLEPDFEGRPLRLWIQDLHASDTRVRDRAIEAVCAIGKPAVPALMVRLRRTDSVADTAVTWARARGPEWVQRRFQSWLISSQIRAVAALALRRMGPDAEQAAPQLIWALGDGDTSVARLAEYALGTIGAPAVPELSQAVAGPHRSRRIAALRILSQLGRAAEASVPAVRSALHDSDPRIRLRAAEAVWRILGDAGSATPALLHLAQSGDPTMQREALAVLVTIGPRSA